MAELLSDRVSVSLDRDFVLAILHAADVYWLLLVDDDDPRLMDADDGYMQLRQALLPLREGE